MKHYLMFDIGTGNSRVSLVDSNGNILGIRTFLNTYYRDDSYEDAQYFYPDEWAEKLINGCAELCAEHPDVKVDGISSAAARQTFILIDAAGNCFYALPNIDNRGREYVGAVTHKEEIYKISGKWVTEDFGAAKLLGLKKKHFDQYSKISKITSLSEWIGYILTGKVCMEYSQACESQLYDLQKKRWSSRLCEWYGVDSDILPELYKSGQRLGHIRDEFREKFNLNEGAMFIACGGGFQSMALCKMIASLTGKPIVLKKGFDQATIQGLVAICNKTLEVAADHEDEYIRVEPDQDNLVFTYYPAWSENRNRANNCQ